MDYLKLYGVFAKLSELRPLSDIKFSEVNKIVSILIDKDKTCGHIEFADDKGFEEASKYLKYRVDLIDDSLSSLKKGLANDLFYPNTSGEQLELRKGFAFFNFSDYAKDVSQSDVYFTINTVINSLRHSEDYEHCLRQTEFVRNLLDPHNFNRYNDGIIQASILRSAKPSELAYHLDEEISSEMKSILEKVIEQHHTPQGEGLNEFLYAISSGKLTLKTEHLISLSNLTEKIIDNQLVSLFNLFIKATILFEKESLTEQIESLKAEIKNLKETT